MASLVTAAQVLSSQMRMMEHAQQMSTALSSNLVMTNADLALLTQLQHEQHQHQQHAATTARLDDEDEEEQEVTPPHRSPEQSRATPSSTARYHVASSPQTDRRSGTSGDSASVHRAYSAHPTPRPAASPQQPQPPRETTMDLLQVAHSIQHEFDDDESEEEEADEDRAPFCVSSLPPTSSSATHSSTLILHDRHAEARSFEAAIQPLIRRSQERSETSLKGTLRRTSLEARTSIETLQRQLTSERKKNSRLVEQRKLLEASCELSQREAATARSHSELLESQARAAANTLEEQRAYIAQFETRFSIGGSEEPLLASRKKISQLTASLAAAQEELERQKKETLAEKLQAEEQRAFIKVLERSLEFKARELNEHFSGASSRSNEDSEHSRKSRLLDGMSTRSAPQHASGATTVTPLHLTKYSLVDIAARSCKRELDTQMAIALERQHEAEEALVAVEEACARQIAQLKRELAEERTAMQDDFDTRTRESQLASQAKEQSLMDKARQLDASFHAKLESVRDECARQEAATKAHAASSLEEQAIASTRVATEYRSRIEHTLEQLRSEQNEKASLLDFIEDLTHKLSQSAEHAQQQRAQIDAAEQDSGLWQQQSKELEQTIEQMTAQLQEAETRVAELTGDVNALRAVEEHNHSLTARAARGLDETTQLEAKLEQAQRGRRALEERLMVLECEVARFTQKQSLEGQTVAAGASSVHLHPSSYPASPPRSKHSEGRLSASALQTPAAAPHTHFGSASLFTTTAAPMAQSLAALHSSASTLTSESLENQVFRARDLGTLQARLQHFEEAHGDFESRLHARDAEKQALQARLTSLQQSMQAKQQELDALQTKHRELQALQSQATSDLARSTSNAAQHESLQARFEKVSSDRKALQREHAQLQTAFALLQQELTSSAQAHAHALASAHNEVHLVRHELLLQHTTAQSELQAAFDNQKRSWEDTVQRALETQVASLRENERNRSQIHTHDLTLARQQTEEAATHAHRLQQARADAEEQLNDARTTLFDLRAVHEAALSQQRKHYEQLLSAEAEAYTQLTEKLQSERANTSVNTARVRGLEEMVESLKVSLSSSHSDLLRAKEQHTKLTAQVEESRKGNANAAAQLEHYKHSMSVVETQLADYKAEVVELEHAALSAAIDASTKRLAASDQALEKSQGELHLMRQSLAHDKADATSSMQRLRDETWSKEKQAQELEVRAKTAEKQASELKRERQEIMFELQTVTKKHAESLHALREKETANESLRAKLQVSHHSLDQELSKRRGFEEGLWAATSAAAHAPLATTGPARSSLRDHTPYLNGHESTVRRRHDDDSSYLLELSSARQTREESPAPTRGGPSSGYVVDAASSFSSHTTTFVPAAAPRPTSKVDERLKRIQSTFANLKANKF